MCTGAVIFSSYLRARVMAKTNQRCVVVSSAAAQQPTPHNRCIVLIHMELEYEASVRTEA